MNMDVREPSAKYLLRKDYRPSKVGPIPRDWTLSTVGAEFDVQLGKMLDAERNVGMEKPYLGNKAVQWGRVVVSETQTMRMSRADLEKFRLQSGDLLVCEGGEIGRAAIWDAPISECYFQKALHRLRPLRGYEPRFMLPVMQLWASRGVLANYVTQTSIAHLTKEKFVEVPIPLPPPAEQRAVASALTDADALIAGLERLIAKKRDIKQAAMQQLLTGQTRLSGFSGNWETQRLGRLGAFLKGSGVKRDQAQSGNLPCIRYGEIYTVHSDVVRTFHSHISPQVSATATRIQIGDLLFAGSGETKAEIGKCVAIASPVEAYAGGDIVILRLRAGDPTFFGYLLNTPLIVRQKANRGQGDAVVHISVSALSSIELQVPTVEEQSAIAIVLSTIDADLSALESRLAKTRAIKQGMMQELLTGRTRLVDSVEQAHVQKTEAAEERKANVYFMRSVLAAEIVDQLHEEPTFGHVKFEKMMFLAEHLCHVDTGSHYARKAAGPLDRKALHSIDSQLRSQKWFDGRKEDGRYRYVPLDKRGGHKNYFDRYFAPIRTQLSEILDTFRSWDTERCEIVATLYAAWNDLRQEKGSVSDEMIVHEVLNNWHESKQRIPEERWLKALGWMREKNYVPGTIAEPNAR